MFVEMSPVEYYSDDYYLLIHINNVSYMQIRVIGSSQCVKKKVKCFDTQSRARKL